ncbi:hypothetical protein K501DRAFT_335673 [Backusella circina FSU 941]|nr:hypothetical protein K501DRAFT_335673 [Backusella circina FSU 941]
MPKASFECELCKKPIARRSLLSIHAHNYHSPKYTVNVPSTSGTVEVIHVARDEHGLVNCTICNASYKSINALRNHATRLCMNKDVTTCPYCNAAINNKLYLIQHINESHKPQAKVKIVTESGGLEEITLTRGEDAKFKCLFCNIKHKWSYAIRDHILYCPNNTKDKPKIADLSCPFCEKVCESKIKLDKHRNNNHNKTVAIKIPAGSGWKEVTVVRNEEGKLPCPLCGNHYSSTGSIRLHIRRNCLKGVPCFFMRL